MTAQFTLVPVFLLDEPHYHRVRRGEVNRFRGVAFPVTRMTAAGMDVPANLPSPDVASFIAGADHCRFEFEMRYDEPFDFIGDGHLLWRYDPAGESFPITVPMPPPEVITITQGGGNVDAYRDSIISGLTTMKAIVDHDPRDILDIGCGTGRMLIGWWETDRSRHLAGVDINPDLIRWNQEHMPQVADWRVSDIEPPLPFADHSFDLIQLISVFTHLPLHRQGKWLDEIQRLLKPNGNAIITLHGEIYAALMLDQTLRHQFELDGHVSVAGAAEGANAFASFHTPRFARELFRGFDVTFYERGPRNLFPIATLQDVYVLRSSRS